jgi:SAM-dependent methyltransferase
MTATAIAPQRLLDARRLAAMVGTTPDRLPAASLDTLAANDLSFEVLTGSEREAQLLRALRGADAPDLTVSGPHRATDWERGWNENLRAFEAAACEPATLVPKYNRHLVLRLQGDYVRVGWPGFEYAVYSAIRQHVFATWFGHVDRVVEYGCGTGTSLMLLAQQMPRLQLCGLDWAPSSQAIVAKLAAKLGRPIEAARFDMFQPVPLGLGPRCGVFTSAAMEQLGRDFEPLLQHWLVGEPSICVHLEPIHEEYAVDSLFDEVARRYHERRGYLRGFLGRLRELAAQGRIELLEVRRTGLGSFFHEGYTLVVWRPRQRGQA